MQEGLSNMKTAVANIANTGERILLEKETPLMIARHFCAYRFAKDYVSDKQVLDIGCGEGYGSNYLAQFAAKVTGIDYNSDIIDYAKSKYHKDNLAFCVVEATDLNSLDNRFDIICSFQVIEHIKEADVFLNDIKNLLNNGGIFICSTPNKLDASPHSEVPVNKYHIREYLLEEFRELLKKYFMDLEVIGLKRGASLKFYRRLKKIGLFNFLPKQLNPVKIFYEQIDCDNFIFVKEGIDTALDFIAVCKK
jgi:2-polyprenyl-3-methyl-5-hydroxy-6-metoxy-1,4-benzoquinol methylase